MDVEWSKLVELEHPWQSTTASHNNDISIVVIWRISFESFTRRRRRASQRSSECYTCRRRQWCCGVAPNQTKDLL